ncbi:MAG: hypothetical protein ACRENE_29650 [Polyangiaceae bacterium]
MTHRIPALSALALVTLVCCGGQALVPGTGNGDDGGPSSSSSGGTGGSSGPSSSGISSGGSSGVSSSGTGGSSGGSSSGSQPSSSGSPFDANADAPACTGHYDGGPRPAPAQHRAQAGSCPATTTGCISFEAGTGGACATNADCVGDGSYTPYSTCLHAQCSLDQCLADSDCPSGQACLCGSQQYGNACFHSNRCVPADCRLDSDCGAGSYCAPNPSACGIEGGYHCHEQTDSCFDATDCACTGGYASVCAYSSFTGGWVCQQITCAG